MVKRYGMFAVIVAATSLVLACSTTPIDSPPTSTTTESSTVTTTETVTAQPPATTTKTTARPTSADRCDKGWDTLPDSTAPRLVRGAIEGLRTGRHDDQCFDRIVIDVATSEAVGFHVEYVDAVHFDASGALVVVGGKAVLQVVIDAPTPMDRGRSYNTGMLDWQALQEVRYAGTFEGTTTLAVGVAKKLLFAVYHLPGTSGHTLVIIDIAYR